MGGWGGLILGEEERARLRELARSPRRKEADRARAILRLAEGESSTAIAAMLGTRPDGVRRWAMTYRRRGIDALREGLRPGRTPLLADLALPAVRQILAEPVPVGLVWTVPRLAEEVARRTGKRISASWLRCVMREKGGFAGRRRGTRSRAGKMWLPSSDPGYD